MATPRAPEDPRDDPDAESWLQVLAGESQPADQEQMRAAALRQHLAARLEDQPTAEQAAAREQRRKLLMNLMEASAPAPAGQPVAAGGSTPGGPLASLVQWLFPGTSAGGWRLAGAAAGVMALAVVVGGNLRTGAEDEHLIPKSAPGASAPLGLPAGETLVSVGAEPLARASELRAQLLALGVTAEVVALADEAELTADVAEDKRRQVQDLLARQGLAWAGAGPGLRVSFRVGR